MNNWKRTLYIMFFAQMVTAVGFSSIFPFLPLYVENLGAVSGLSIEFLAGLVFSGQAISMMIVSPIWGSLADRYGRKLMVLRSMFGGAVILFVMAFARSAEELVILRFIQGFITGSVSAANALLAAEAPRGRLGYVMGSLQVALGTGVAIGPILGGTMADAFGYQSAFYMTAGLLILAGILVWWGVEENFEPPEPTKERRSGLTKWKGILSAPGVMMTYGLRFMVLLGRMMIVPIAPLFINILLVTSNGLEKFSGLIIGVVIGAAAAATTLSSLYLGKLGDRIGHRKVAVVSTLIAGAFYFPQGLVTEWWHLLILQAMVGVAMGGVIPAISALLADYTEKGEAGAVYGLENSINAAARAVAPLIGSVVAVWFGLRSTFIATGILLFGASLMAFLYLPKPKVRTKQDEREWSKESNMDYK